MTGEKPRVKLSYSTKNRNENKKLIGISWLGLGLGSRILTLISIVDLTLISIVDLSLISIVEPTLISIVEPTLISVVESTLISIVEPTLISQKEMTNYFQDMCYYGHSPTGVDIVTL